MPELMVVKNGSGTHKSLRLDTATEALKCIDFADHKRNEGDEYTVTYLVADLGAATTPNDVMSLAFSTPDTTKWLHMNISLVSVAGTRFRLIEGSTGGGGAGTGDLTVYNSNRNSTNTSGIISHAGTPAAGKVTYDSNLFTGGTSIIDVYLGTNELHTYKLILKQNTKYQTSLYNTANDVGSISLTWSEHTDLS